MPQSLVPQARLLRKRMTPQEAKLWVKLRELKPRGFHFRKQAPIDRFIVDFVCFTHRLVIEVDGGQHAVGPHIGKDRQRDSVLKASGFAVLRFWNSDIDQALDGVVETILAELTAPHPDRLTPVVPPRKGEGNSHHRP